MSWFLLRFSSKVKLKDILESFRVRVDLRRSVAGISLRKILGCTKFFCLFLAKLIRWIKFLSALAVDDTPESMRLYTLSLQSSSAN
jgi:hypothetical protein